MTWPPVLGAGGPQFESGRPDCRNTKPCKRLHACGVSSVRVQYPAKSPIGHPQDRFRRHNRKRSNIGDAPPLSPAGGGTGPTSHTSPLLNRRFLKKIGGAAQSGVVLPPKLLPSKLRSYRVPNNRQLRKPNRGSLPLGGTTLATWIASRTQVGDLACHALSTSRSRSFDTPARRPVRRSCGSVSHHASVSAAVSASGR